MNISLRLLILGALGIVLTVTGCTLDRLGKAIGDHLCTTSNDERDFLVASTDYRLDGIVGYVYPSNANITSGIGTEAVPFYRLYNPGNGDHFYTTSYKERYKAIAGDYIDDGYCISEGGTPGCISFAGRIFPVKTELVPLIRLYQINTGDHAYTTSASEKAIALSAGYVDEGIAGFIFPTQQSGTLPLYRLSNGHVSIYIPD